MRRIKINKHLLVACITLSLLTTVFLAAGIAAEREDVIYATLTSGFRCKGGDPATLTGAPPFVSRTVFDSLTTVTTNRVDLPALAKSFKVAPGWKYIDFFLRNDVKFHNGDPVTAQDVKFTLETYMRKDLKYVFGAIFRNDISQIEIMSPTQVRVHLVGGSGLLARLWWGGGIMPKAYREKVGDDGFADKPIGTGPFKWAGYKQDEWMKFEAVSKHYRKTPEIKTLKIVFVAEPSTILAMLKAGEVDIASLIGPHAAEIKNDPNFKIQWVKEVSGSNMYYGDMLDPTTPSPFLDVRVRRAVNIAIDRKGICERLLFNASEPWGDVLPSLCLGFDKTLKPPVYDPEGAKKLLAEAGYAKGFSTTMHVQTTSASWAEAIAANLADIGIQTKVEKWEPGAYYGNYFGKKFRGLIPYVGWFDPEHTPTELSDFYLKGTLHAYYTTDEMDQLLRKAKYADTDEELVDLGRKMSKYLRESQITTFLWANHSPYGLSSKIKYWEPVMGGAPPIEFETIKLNR
jgi:peptide/nickel transport system substrate-binding protein